MNEAVRNNANLLVRSLALVGRPGAFGACAARPSRAGLPDLPRRRQHDRQLRDTASPSTGKNSATAFTAACNARTATRTSRAIRIPTRLRRWIARPATPTRRISSEAACTPTARSIRAQAATAMRTKSFPRPTRARRCIRSTCPRPAASATATTAWRASTAWPASIQTTSIRFTGLR